MICRAVEAGTLAMSCLKSGPGCVDAVFSKSMSLSYPPYSVVLIEDRYASPLGIIVEGLDTLRPRVTPGWHAWWSQGSLFLEGLALDFSEVLERDDLRQEIRYAASREARIKAKKKLEIFLRSYFKETPLISALFKAGAPQEKWEESFARDRFQTQLASLFSAAHSGNGRAAAKSAACFCGLGMGLTPAGDDFLTGLIALLNSLEMEEKEYAFTEGFLTELKNLLSPEMTNSWGWSFVRPAFDRWQSAPLTEALCDILQCGNGQAVRMLAEIGSSSGLDQLCGIVAGLQMMETLPREMLKERDLQ